MAGGRRDGSAGGGGVRADVPLVGWEGGYALGEVADGVVMGLEWGISGLVGEGREPEERLVGEVVGF